jgi:site-specific DNA-methyltransferase (adenine-specific)
MATLDDNSIDAIVCDPPYELGFMGKAWDNTGIAYDVTVWQQCLRVLKPGGHLIAFGGSRTYHRLAVAIEDAGFEIRDQIQWIYGNGFPKSLDIVKQMDKNAGIWRGRAGKADETDYKRVFDSNYERTEKGQAVTENAKQWDGWGTALKPAHEPAVLARKPLCSTVADNVMTWGVGGLNIDGTRVPSDDAQYIECKANDTPNQYGYIIASWAKITRSAPNTAGRWPANVIFDEDAAVALDMQSGGNVSRFFYTAKASKSEREAGLYYEEWQPSDIMVSEAINKGSGFPLRANHHPTVKPLSLMRYLVRLVTPKGGKVLDPFMGSGSTGCASILEGFDFVGIDITPEYVAIAQKRIDYYAVTSPLEGF